MTGLVVCVAVLAVAGILGMLHKRRDGRVRVRDKDAAQQLTAGEIGAELGERATLLQFSTTFCAPCRATRRTLGEVAGMVDGVRHVEIDAEAHLDLVHAAGHRQDADRARARRPRHRRAACVRPAAQGRRHRGARRGRVTGARCMTPVPPAGAPLTWPRSDRQPDAMSRDLLLYSRFDVDLGRHASARCHDR